VAADPLVVGRDEESGVERVLLQALAVGEHGALPSKHREAEGRAFEVKNPVIIIIK